MKKLFILFLLAGSLLAGIKTFSVIAQGYGITEDEAVKNALVNAVGQAKGLAISARKRLQRKIKEAHVSINGVNAASIKVSDATSSAISTATGGFVKSYRILYVKKVGPGEYKAKVKAYFTKYKAPGLNPRNRRSLAVLPFSYKPTYSLDGIAIDGKELSRRLTQAIVNKITQTRKFTVLDRQNSRYYEFERRFLLSPGTDPVELARIGKRLGADYFIIGEIVDFGVGTKAGNSLIGASDTSNMAYATINYRILNIPTQQIKWSDTIDIEFELPHSNRAESLIAKASNKIAQVLVDQIMFNIYPPKIIGKRGSQAIVNMGGNVLHRGDRFKVYALGKRLYDPYTKEPLGRDEIEIGEVEITKVLPKISYAKIVSGKVKKGAILRPVESEEENEPDGGKESMFEEMFHK